MILLVDGLRAVDVGERGRLCTAIVGIVGWYAGGVGSKGGRRSAIEEGRKVVERVS